MRRQLGVRMARFSRNARRVQKRLRRFRQRVRDGDGIGIGRVRGPVARKSVDAEEGQAPIQKPGQSDAGEHRSSIPQTEHRITISRRPTEGLKPESEPSHEPENLTLPLLWSIARATQFAVSQCLTSKPCASGNIRIRGRYHPSTASLSNFTGWQSEAMKLSQVTTFGSAKCSAGGPIIQIMA
jgi:hypothetical protein